MKKNKNNKGFTFVELLATISIIAIMTTLITISYTNYRENAKEKELETLRKSVVTSLQNYLINPDNPFDGSSINLLELKNKGAIKDLNFNNKKFTDDDLQNSTIRVIQKSTALSRYNNDETKMIEDGVCLTTAEYNQPEGSTSVNPSDITVKCDKDTNGNIIGSSEDGYCLYIRHENIAIINDRQDGKLYCR